MNEMNLMQYPKRLDSNFSVALVAGTTGAGWELPEPGRHGQTQIGGQLKKRAGHSDLDVYRNEFESPHADWALKARVN
jgi:hypothetical protein